MTHVFFLSLSPEVSAAAGAGAARVINRLKSVWGFVIPTFWASSASYSFTQVELSKIVCLYIFLPLSYCPIVENNSANLLLPRLKESG